ncbi:glycoside hydrolase family protein [Acetobacter oryzifermentans]|uniref:glycoside hydrolase family protein n=1 Tax=Acetobacter oryzifermentans TaxID=1633874 RepID=UPI0039BFF296
MSALAGSTLLSLLNAGQGNAARNQLLLWNHMHRNGQLITVAGLTLRRRAEWQMWAS